MVCYTGKETSSTAIDSMHPTTSRRVFESEKRSRAMALHQHPPSETLSSTSPPPLGRGR
jgi:hypothetical protein